MDQIMSVTVHPTVAVVLAGAAASWSANVPGLACMATGHSQEEVTRTIEQALTYYVEQLRDIDAREDAVEAAAAMEKQPQ